MSTAKIAIKESLIGVEKEPDLSLQNKELFDRNCRKDEVTGEEYMLEDDFVSAIAPPTENYVSLSILQSPAMSKDELSLTGARL